MNTNSSNAQTPAQAAGQSPKVFDITILKVNKANNYFVRVGEVDQNTGAVMNERVGGLRLLKEYAPGDSFTFTGTIGEETYEYEGNEYRNFILAR